MSLLLHLQDSFGRHAARTALSVEGGTRAERLSYSELWQRAERFGDEITRAGLAQGELVGLFMRKGPELVARMLGVWLAGGAFVILNGTSRWPQLRRLQERAQMRWLLADGASLAQLDVETGCHETGVPLVAVDVEGDFQRARADELWRAGLVAPLSACAGGRRADGAHRGLGCCLMTSGSSGEPKGVLIERQDLLRRASTEARDFGLAPDDRLLSLVPLSFDVGLNQWLSSLLAGAELVVLRSWLPADIARTVAGRRISGISAVPTIWQTVLASGDALAAPLSGLRYVTVSGGALSADGLVALRRLLPHTGIFKTYGQSETFRSTILRPAEYVPERWATVGRAVDGCEVYVIDAQGRPVPAGESGEVMHRGAGTMLGYLGDPEGTARKLKPAPALTGTDDLVVATGDMGSLDRDGYLTLHGRRDMMIKTSGLRVYPGEVENELLACPEVAEAAVLGIPDPVLGQKVAAALVPRNEADALVEHVQTRLRRRLPPYMVPQIIRLLRALPRGPSGKVQYGELKRLLELEGSP